MYLKVMYKQWWNKVICTFVIFMANYLWNVPLMTDFSNWLSGYWASTADNGKLHWVWLNSIKECIQRPPTMTLLDDIAANSFMSSPIHTQPTHDIAVMQLS